MHIMVMANKKAIFAYRSAFQLDNSLLGAKIIGCIAKRQNHYDEALKAYNEVIALNLIMVLCTES
jgi:hypothetical protein